MPRASSRRKGWTAVRLPSLADFRKCAKAINISCQIGVFIGILPALGASVVDTFTMIMLRP